MAKTMPVLHYDNFLPSAISNRIWKAHHQLRNAELSNKNLNGFEKIGTGNRVTCTDEQRWQNMLMNKELTKRFDLSKTSSIYLTILYGDISTQQKQRVFNSQMYITVQKYSHINTHMYHKQEQRKWIPLSLKLLSEVKY